MNEKFCVPLKTPSPDIQRMIDILMGKRVCDKPPLVEYIIDDVHLKTLMSILDREWIDASDRDTFVTDKPSRREYLDNFIEAWYRLGYDYVRIERNVGFTFSIESAHDSTKSDDRGWQDYSHPVIESEEDFERYPWPSVTDESFADIEYVNNHLPDGMGLISSHAAGVYEHLSWIMGYENLCILLYEKPELVKMVAEKIGQIMEEFYTKLLQFENLAVVWPGDDMGFRTATLIRPEQLREYVLPWHRRFAEITHNAGLPYFLHSCGNLFEIMDDLIDDVKIDAKHSYEDAIMPVTEFQERYGSRIGILGGVDVDILTTKSTDDIRKHVREIIDTCGPRGRYAIGSGNSIPSYVPLEHFFTMLDEALK